MFLVGGISKRCISRSRHMLNTLEPWDSNTSCCTTLHNAVLKVKLQSAQLPNLSTYKKELGSITASHLQGPSFWILLHAQCPCDRLWIHHEPDKDKTFSEDEWMSNKPCVWNESPVEKWKMCFTEFKAVSDTLVKFEDYAELEMVVLWLEMVGTKYRWHRYLIKVKI